MSRVAAWPEYATAIHRRAWRARGESIGVDIDVLPCPYSAEQLAELDAGGRTVGYLPPQLATRAGRHVLGAMFPAMKSYCLHRDNAFPNLDNPSGWFDYESSIDAPHLGTTEAEVVTAARAGGRETMTLNQYIVASQDTKAFTGRYLDERRTWCRLGSTCNGVLVGARFDGQEIAEGLGDEAPVDGSLLVGYDVAPGDCGPTLGGRTAGWSAAGRGLVEEDAGDAAGPDSSPVRRAPWASEELAERRHALADRYIALGCHVELGLTETQYRATLPGFVLPPDAHRARYDVPLLIEPRVSWKRLAERAGIALSFGARDNEYVPVATASPEPAAPYTAWFGGWGGGPFPDPIAPGDALAALAPGEAGGTLHELVALHLAHPELAEQGRFFDVIGYTMAPAGVPGLKRPPQAWRTPCIYHFRGRAEIGANLHPSAFPMFRPLVRSIDHQALNV